MSLTKTEEYVIRNLIKRLRCEPVKWQDGTEHPGEADKVRDALTGDAKLFLESWVIAPLELLLPGDDRDPELAWKLSCR
jgi:hypothetical protein